jgi:hypothetical protein
MLPANDLQNFPQFVPDQVLTSENLNQLFGYLDAEGRMTRTNLIGIGIVCGMEVKNSTDSDGHFIAITKGTGVTSSGYLITTPENGVVDVTETRYHKFRNFDAAQCRYYEPFVNIATKTQRFPLWELMEKSETTGTSPLNSIPGGLGDKVVMMFVELKEANNKNCDPNSCDDKGINVDVSFKPLLVRQADALNLINTGGTGVSSVSFNNLETLMMPRWNVPNTHPVSSDDIINSYRTILTPAFIQHVEDVLTLAHTMFKPIVAYEYPNNPFLNLAEKFVFLGNPVLSTGHTVHMQYYYDFFSDMMQAYEEFCKTGKELMSVCCPDETLFPRHLLLGEAIPLADHSKSSFRHYFIYSPLFECRNLIFILRTLFRRMHLMLDAFATPASSVGVTASDDANIRITPSQLGNVPLSVKAIPYYYRVTNTNDSLHKFWSPEKKLRNKTDQTLCYNADGTYATEMFVKKPLLFDIEPYNFFRVEGVVGKNITGVLSTVQKRIERNRLPVQVVALKTGEPHVEGFNPKNMGCNIQDLETSFDIIRREWEAVIGKTVEYLNENKEAAKTLIDNGHPNQLQHFIQDLYLSKTYIEDVRENLPAFTAMFYEFILVYERIESKSEAIRRQLMAMLNNQEANINRLLAEDIIDHMDEVVISCRKGGFRAIYQEYMKRLEEIYAKMFFSGYAKSNPGLQHKAGVPQGGTYILVYHAKPVAASLTLSNKMKSAAKKGPFVIQGIVVDKSEKPVMGAQVREKSGRKAETSVNGKFTLSLEQLPTVISVKANGFETYEEILTSPDKKKEIKLKAELAESAGVAGLATGTVIADFYLPYSCCSDCAPLQFVIQEPPPNRPPVAMAGDDISIRLPQNTVTMDGSSSADPDENIVSYTWAYKSGPASFVIGNPAIIKTDVQGLTEGDYVFTLTVTDAGGLTSVDEVKITVLPALNQPPVANAGNDTQVTLPATVTLIGTASDPDGPAPALKWTLKSAPTGATANITGDTTLNPVISFTRAGLYVFTLTATDNKGATASDDISVAVNDVPNQLPIVNAGNDTGITLPASVNLNGSASDPDNPAVAPAVKWTKKSGPAGAVIAGDTTLTPSVSFISAGTYVFTLTATDNRNGIASDDVTVTVLPAINQLPQVNAGSDQQFTLPATVTLQGSASDPDGPTPSVKWKINAAPAGVTVNIQNDTTLNPSVALTVEGTYIFTLTATDDKGDTASDDVTVVVTKPQVARNCGKLSTVISLFTKLESIDPANFPGFKGDIFTNYAQVEAYFRQTNTLAGSSTEEQIDHFINFKGVNSQLIDQLLQTWLNELFKIITNPNRKNSHLLAWGMYRVLTALTLYIACIQDEDVTVAKMPMFPVLLLMLQQFSGLTAAQVAGMSAGSRSMINGIKRMFIAALTNLKDSNNIISKPEYGDILLKIIDTITALGL